MTTLAALLEAILAHPTDDAATRALSAALVALTRKP